MPTEQHPIPQDVSGYRFRLVGDMTLKQFIQLASGIVLAFIFWKLPLPFFFKLPLVAVSAGLGIGMAFVPIEGRPLDQWLVAFFKSIYSPTIYTWQKIETKTNSNSPVLHPSASLNTPSVSKPAAVPTKQNPLNYTLTTPNTNSLPTPFTPTTSNTITGLIITPDQKIIDHAIIEISQNNLTIRATKTNQLGQFLFARPLDNGNYTLSIEKPGLQFESYSLNLTGQIVPPLKITAKN